MALVSTLFGCGDDEGVLYDQDARRLVEQVLTDLDLPGEPEPPIDPAEIPEGELEFGFHCQIRSAGFDIDDVLVAFPPPEVGHEEFPGGDIERVEVAILVFDTAASASAVLAAHDVEGTADCLSRTFSEPVDLEADDSLEAGGVTAEGFAISIGDGGLQPEGHRTFAVVSPGSLSKSPSLHRTRAAGGNWRPRHSATSSTPCRPAAPEATNRRGPGAPRSGPHREVAGADPPSTEPPMWRPP